MHKLKIGTAGIPNVTKPRSSQNAIKTLAKIGLDCMELEFVRGVQMKEKTAKELRSISEENSISLTVHAPYYVNLNSREEEKITASRDRIFRAAQIGWAAGAKSLTFHAAYYHDDDHEIVYQRVKEGLQLLRKRLDDEGIDLDLRPETTGSPTQFGTIPEIVRLATEIPGVYPCIDFSHLHARSQGAYNNYEEISEVLEFVQAELGKSALAQLHMHLSGIEYGAKGEKKHLILKESDMNYKAVLQALVDFNVGGWLICESPNLEEDALLLKHEYNQLKGGIGSG